MVKSIIKRIIVSVGVIVSLAFLSQYLSFLNIFNINVFAQTNDDEPPFKVGIFNDSGSPTSVQTQEGIYSNIFTDDNSFTDFFDYYLFGVDTSSCQEDYCNMVADPIRVWRHQAGINRNVEFPFPYQHSTDVTYMGSVGYSISPKLKLKKSNHYTLFLAIYKGSNDIRFNENCNVELDYLNVVYDNSSHDIMSIVDNLTTDFHIFHYQNDSQSKWAYIKVEFDTDSNFESISNGSDIYFDTIRFYINNPFEGIADIVYPFNSLLYFPSSKTNDVYVKNYVYIIENGEIYYTGVDCDKNSGSCHSGSSLTSAMDYVSFEDIEVVNTIPTCPSEPSLSSILCNIERIFKLIQKFFTRFGNFFKELFNDSIQFDLDTNSDMTPVSSLLTMPITLLNAFLTGVDATCSTYNFGSLYGYSFSLSCISLSSYLGSTLWVIIDGLCGIFMCFNIGRLIVTFFDKSTSLDDMFGLMYHYHDYEVKSDPNYNVDDIHD